MFKKLKHILWFKELNKKDGPLVGGKNASLGEMFSNLVQKGINIPDGFALTSKAYWYFLKANGLDAKIKEIFSEFDPKDMDSLTKTGEKTRELILSAEFPKDLKAKIIKSYKKLSRKYGEENTDVAIRSSATAEDLATASFAGQMETYLNIKGEEELLKAAKKCIASLFTDRSISYREQKGFNHLTIALSVCVQKMVRSDKASSGIMFTLDTETGFENVVLINSIWGLGEMIVQGKITPDEFFVFKPTFKKGFKSIIVKNLGRKNLKYVYGKEGGLREERVSPKDHLRFSLEEKEVLTLAKWACQIQDHYGKHMDIEWAKDGLTKKLFIVQARPETIHLPSESRTYVEYTVKTKAEPILKGIAIGDKIGIGKVRVISDVSKMNTFKEGEVLVTKMTDPDWVPVMRIAKAIVTDEGGKTCFSGETKVLTNKGFLPIKTIVEDYAKEDLFTPSVNRETLDMEWKKIIGGFEKNSSVAKVEVSQTGNMKDNYLETTLDHKFIHFSNRELVSEEIGKLISDSKDILTITSIPKPNIIVKQYSGELAYLHGAIITDGHIVYREYDGKINSQVFFIQKETAQKVEFIEKMKACFRKEFGYELHTVNKKATHGIIRGKEIRGGESISLKFYKHNIVSNFLNEQKDISNIILGADENFAYNFLAGVIDGDGSYNPKSNRVNIYCSKEELLNAITVVCLRLNINYQVTRNRDIWNIQITDKIEEIFKYTSRVRGEYSRGRIGIRLFSAKQLLADIIERVNYKGRILPYLQKSLLIDSEKIRNYIIPMIKGQPENHALTKIINSSLKSIRVSSDLKMREEKVYNIEVEDNHNYIVFTKRNTPLLVENCHAAIVARELGVPTIVGTQGATDLLKTGQLVTIDCTQGMNGRVYEGEIPFEKKEYDLKKIPNLKTKIMMNIGSPDIAFKTSFLPNDGVGLAREEFIINEKIKVHPLALYNFKSLKDKVLKNRINKITIEHKDKREYFIKELAEGVSQIAAAFYPKPVIVRFSDFKTNEYRNLVGGELYEGEESNPMIGFRGASRYIDETFQPAFRMECQAIKRARETFGLDNISVMVPFCRTVEEGEKVRKLINKFGLKDVKVYVMCEIPSNVVLIDKFLDIFDGMSIGSNDLTQLTVGLDRDNAKIAHITDERNDAVKKLISKVIKECNKRNKYVGICGQAPSDYLEFAKYLQEEGIGSMSLNPDTVIKTIMMLAEK